MYEALRKIVLDAIQEAVEKKLINGTSGNIAARDSKIPILLPSLQVESLIPE